MKSVWSMNHKSMYIKEEHNKVVLTVKTGKINFSLKYRYHSIELSEVL